MISRTRVSYVLSMVTSRVSSRDYEDMYPTLLSFGWSSDDVRRIVNVIRMTCVCRTYFSDGIFPLYDYVRMDRMAVLIIPTYSTGRTCAETLLPARYRVTRLRQRLQRKAVLLRARVHRERVINNECTLN